MMKMKDMKKKRRSGDSCHGTGSGDVPTGLKKIALVGNPNVGKSVLFHNLTGKYVTVSNYPGTTVDVSRGIARFGGMEFEIIDTPGMYSLSPITDEERVARRILIDECPYLVLHVVDAKNLDRMLSFTLQLLEAELPTILVLNIMDEAKKSGIEINIKQLERELRMPVVGTVAATRTGMDELEGRILEYVNGTEERA